MDAKFEGRHVVVTGASGALGAAVVERLLAAGATCHVPLRGADPPGALRNRDRVHPAGGIDLADEAAVAGFYGALPSLWASVHCAGGFAMAPLAETRLEDLRAMWTLNCAVAFLCCRESARAMRAGGGGGRIVNVVSRQALEPRMGAGMTAYASSKAALAGLTVAMAAELGGDGIRVNAVAPGILDTETNRKAMPGADRSGWVRLEDAAEVIAFLASPANAVAHGALVPLY